MPPYWNAAKPTPMMLTAALDALGSALLEEEGT